MNLHRLDDANNQQPQRHHQGGLEALGPNIARFPFLGQRPNHIQPRKQTYSQMLHITLCPQYQLGSLTTIIIAANTLLYILCLFDGIQKDGSLLQVQEQSLILRGGLVNNMVKQDYYYQQLFTSIFLSFDFMQYFIHSLLILIFLSNIEYATGPIAAGIIYIFGGALGALFGCFINCCDDAVFLHTQTSIYALIGSLVGFFILNWDSLAPVPDIRACFCIFIWIGVTLCLVLTFAGSRTYNPNSDKNTNKGIDQFGCLGGLMAGMFLSLAIGTPMKKESFEQKATIFGWTFLCILAVMSFTMFQI